MSVESTIVLNVLRTVTLNISSARPPPRVLLRPPVEVRVYASFQILTPIQYVETFLGKKPTVETKYSAIVYLRERDSGETYRVMESSITFMHVMDEKELPENIIGKPPSQLPKEVVEQLVAVTVQEALPILVMLFDKHMVPVAVPIDMEVRCQLQSEGAEDSGA